MLKNSEKCRREHVMITQLTYFYKINSSTNYSYNLIGCFISISFSPKTRTYMSSIDKEISKLSKTTKAFAYTIY